MVKKRVTTRAVLWSGGIVLVAVLALAVAVGIASAQQCPAYLCPPPTTQQTVVVQGACDGGRIARRWNGFEGDWERNFCDDLYFGVPTHDPFDAVFGYNHGNYSWDYGQAIKYLRDKGISARQLSTYQGQVDALVKLGLWNRTTQSIPPNASLNFLWHPGPQQGPGIIPNLPLS